jgi:CDP-diacylglycerol--glycerol-3-phosphate 3-phosphatidyltransferase
MMFGSEIQRQARSVAEHIMRPIARLGISADVVSLMGLALNGVAAGVVALGPLRWGGVMVLFASVFDMADGAVARVQKKASLFGAFLDSVLDRYAEGLLFLGVIIYAQRQLHGTQQIWVIVLSYVAALFSLLVSYTRARAEGLGLDGKVGLMERPERVLLLGFGLFIGDQVWLPWVLGVLVVLTGVTGIQRIMHVRRQARGVSAAAATPRSPHNAHHGESINHGSPAEVQ